MDATTNTTERLSSSRWMVLAIIVAVQFQIMLVTFAPAAVASSIISDLQLTRTKFGLIMSALNIAIMICQVLGSVLVDRAGLKLGLLSGIALLGIGAALLLRVHSLEFLLLGRVLQGIGIGICYPVMGALIVAWFSKREQPYINTIFAAVTFLGIGSGMLVTVGLFGWFNRSWRQVIGTYGLSILATALIWLVIGRNRQEAVSAGETSAPGATIKNPNSLPKVLTMPVVWTLGLATFAISWVYNMDFSFMPLFLESGHGISLADANRLASLLPFSGVAGVILFGVLASRATWRKHLLSTSCAVVLLGSMALFFGEGTTTKAGLLVVGFGLSGWLPVLNTYIMGLPSMTPSLMAAFVVLVNMAIYMAGFISPLALGWLSQTSFGLRNSLALFSWIELVAILIFMRLPTIAGVDVQAAREQARLAVVETPPS
jgi:MFS transporter, AAHS family, 3-hydroxyphenylpropionic acid transporter